MDRYDDVLADLDRANSVVADDADLLVLRARTQMQLGRFDEAGRALRRVRELTPSHPELGGLTRACTAPGCA